MTNLTCKMWFTRYDLQITIFSLIELRRYCSELLQHNDQILECHVVQKNLRCHHLYISVYMWEEIMAKLIDSIPLMLSWIKSTVNWLKPEIFWGIPTPLYRIKLVTNQKILRGRSVYYIPTGPSRAQSWIFLYWRISTIFRSFFIVYLASEIFSLINCGSQLLSFFYRTWVPFKSIKKRKRRAVSLFRFIDCFIPVSNIKHEGCKNLFWFIRF